MNTPIIYAYSDIVFQYGDVVFTMPSGVVGFVGFTIMVCYGLRCFTKAFIAEKNAQTKR